MGTELSLATPPIDAMERAAQYLVKSNLFGVKSTDQAIALMLVAHAEGRPFVAAVTDYHVIQGRPALKADTMLARFQAAGGVVTWLEYTDAAVSAEFSHRQSPKPVAVRWTIEDARRAGLGGKDVWKQYPRAMLRARVISEGIRTVFPAVLSGLYTPEEVGDFDARPPAVRHVPDVAETCPPPVKQLAVEYEADVTPPDPDFEREPGSDDDVIPLPPRNNRDFHDWVKGFGHPITGQLVDHLRNWAALRGYPDKVAKYTVAQRDAAYAELCDVLAGLQDPTVKASE